MSDPSDIERLKSKTERLESEVRRLERFVTALAVVVTTIALFSLPFVLATVTAFFHGPAHLLVTGAIVVFVGAVILLGRRSKAGSAGDV